MLYVSSTSNRNIRPHNMFYVYFFDAYCLINERVLLATCYALRVRSSFSKRKSYYITTCVTFWYPSLSLFEFKTSELTVAVIVFASVSLCWCYHCDIHCSLFIDETEKRCRNTEQSQKRKQGLSVRVCVFSRVLHLGQCSSSCNTAHKPWRYSNVKRNFSLVLFYTWTDRKKCKKHKRPCCTSLQKLIFDTVEINPENCTDSFWAEQ